MDNSKNKKKKKKQRINQMTEKQKLKGLAVVVGSIIAGLIVINLLIPSPDSKFIFLKSECTIPASTASGEDESDALMSYYQNFTLYGDKSSLVELSYVSHKETTYYINSVTGERSSYKNDSDEGTYNEFTELFCTMRVKKVLHGGLKKGEKIEFYFAPSEKELATPLIKNKNVYVSVAPSERQEGKFEYASGLDGIFYVKDDKIIPACDVSPAEYHHALMLGEVDNPVSKYKGMTEVEFKRATKHQY